MNTRICDRYHKLPGSHRAINRLDITGFAALPVENKNAVIAAINAAAADKGASPQAVANALTAGYLWMADRYTCYSDTGGTTLIAGTTGNTVNAWRDCSKNALFVVNGTPPTFHSTNGLDFTDDEMVATTADLFGSQNDRTIIFAANQYEFGRNHFISNAVNDSTNDWYVDNSATANGLVLTVNGRSTSGNAAPYMTISANHIARIKAINNSANVDIWVDGIQRVSSTGLTAATANPNPNQLTIHAQTDALAKKDIYYKAIYAYSGNQPSATSALVEAFIDQYFNLNLL